MENVLSYGTVNCKKKKKKPAVVWMEKKKSENHFAMQLIMKGNHSLSTFPLSWKSLPKINLV